MSLFQSLESFAPKKDPTFFKDLTAHAKKALDVVRTRIKSDAALEAAGDTKELLGKLKFTSGVERIIHTHTGLKVSVKLAPIRNGLDYTCVWGYTSKELKDLMKKRKKALTTTEITAIRPLALSGLLKRLPEKTSSGRVSDDVQDIFMATIRIPAWAFVLDKVSESLAPMKDDPELIAAAILHEVGHLLYDLGRLSEVVEHADTVDRIVEILDTQVPDQKAVVDALVAAHATVSALPTSPENKTLLAAISKLQSELKTNTDQSLLDVAVYILRQVSYTLYAASLVGKDDSITDGGAYHSTEEERHADDYAAQCGAGAALAKMLGALHSTDALFDKSKVFTLQSAVLFATSRVEAFKAAFDISPCLVVSSYDTIEKRLQLLSDAVQRSAASQDITLEQREFYLKVLGETDTVIHEFTSAKYITMRNILYGLYKTLATAGVIKMLPALYAQLSHGRQMQDYVQHLFKTPMHSYTSRLESIAHTR